MPSQGRRSPAPPPWRWWASRARRWCARLWLAWACLSPAQGILPVTQAHQAQAWEEHLPAVIPQPLGTG
eukprot:12926776-Prorocentrum_lima.AAC.1